MLTLEVLGGLLVALVLAGVGLRLRKLRRDEIRRFSRPLDRRLVTPPASPYEPSRGFRLLDDGGQPLERPPIERPRLDPTRQYVFSESAPLDDVAMSRSRHSDDWFLSRSAQHSAWSTLLRRVAVVAVVLVVALVIVSYALHKNGPPTTGTTTTTSSTSSTTTTVHPSSYVATVRSGADATYHVALASYTVHVRGQRGPTWATIYMGSANTLEWQGLVAQGSEKSLRVTAPSRVTLGSPSNAVVTIDGSAVVLPSPPTSPQNLIFSTT